MHDNEFDREKGGLKEFGGKVQRGVGDLTGDEEMEAKGAKKETEGKAQNLFGKAKDVVGDAAETVKDAVDPTNGDSTIHKDYRTR
jgi:uncharacterized protein YjbJ (UPF0337 family)